MTQLNHRRISICKSQDCSNEVDYYFWHKWHTSNENLREMLAEFMGTFILVFVITSCSVQAAVYEMPFIVVMVANSYAVFLGVLISAPISNGHINPAITIAQVVTHKFPAKKAALYIVAQFIGAMVATLVAHCMYADSIRAVAGSGYGGVPTPAIYYTTFPSKHMSLLGSLTSEIMSTFMLITSFYLATDSSRAIWSGDKVPGAAVMGWTLPGILASMSAQSMASMNPARDLGPRIVASFVFPNETVWSVPRENVICGGDPYWWVPIVGPILGGILAGVVYLAVIGAHWKQVQRKSGESAGLVSRMNGD